jgi:hypothetical protein
MGPTFTYQQLKMALIFLIIMRYITLYKMILLSIFGFAKGNAHVWWGKVLEHSLFLFSNYHLCFEFGVNFCSMLGGWTIIRWCNWSSWCSWIIIMPTNEVVVELEPHWNRCLSFCNSSIQCNLKYLCVSKVCNWS